MSTTFAGVIPRRGVGRLAIALAWIVTACSRTDGDVMGEVFTVEYGQVRVFPGLEVMVVPKTSQLDAAWRANLDAFSAKYREASAEYQTLKTEAESPATQKARAAWLGAERTTLPKPMPGSKEDIENWLMNTPRRETFPPDQLVREQLQRMVTIQKEHISAAERLLRDRAVATALTNTQGRFEAKSVRIGPHYVWSRYASDYEDELCWMVSIEIQAGAQTLNLSNANAGCPF